MTNDAKVLTAEDASYLIDLAHMNEDELREFQADGSIDPRWNSLLHIVDGQHVVIPADKLAELEADMRAADNWEVSNDYWADRIKKLREGQP